VFRLYMALRRYHEAARTAIVIAQDEQNAGKMLSTDALSVCLSVCQCWWLMVLAVDCAKR